MRIIKYRVVLGKDKNNILEKESATNYQCGELNNSAAVAKMVNDIFALDRQAEEYLCIVAVDAKCKPVGVFEVSHGTVDAALVRPREIYIRALLVGAAGIFLAHNHPSGDSSPSPSDIEITRSVDEAGKLLNINLQDHIIIGNNEHYSCRDDGLL